VKATHQDVESFDGAIGLMIGEVGVTGGGENRLMTEKLL